MILLDQGKRKILEKRMNGTSGWAITRFAVGNADYYEPLANQTGLRSQVFEKPIESIEFLSDREIKIEFELTEEESNTYNLTELGLIDNDGTMILLETFSIKAKNQRREMVFYIYDAWEDD